MGGGNGRRQIYAQTRRTKNKTHQRNFTTDFGRPAVCIAPWPVAAAWQPLHMHACICICLAWHARNSVALPCIASMERRKVPVAYKN